MSSAEISLEEQEEREQRESLEEGNEDNGKAPLLLSEVPVTGTKQYSSLI